MKWKLIISAVSTVAALNLSAGPPEKDYSPLAKPGFVTEDDGRVLRVWQAQREVPEQLVELTRIERIGEQTYSIPITLMGRRLAAVDRDTAIAYYLSIPGFEIEMRHQKEGVVSSPIRPHIFYAGQPTWSIETTLTRRLTIGALRVTVRAMDPATFTDYLASFDAYHRRHTRSLRVDHVGDTEQQMIPQSLWLQRMRSLLAERTADLEAFVGGGDLFIPNAYVDVSSEPEVAAVLAEIAAEQGLPVDEDLIELSAVPLALNELGLDAAGIGNHEGDKRASGFAQMVERSLFPWVVGNADFSSNESFDSLIGDDGAQAKGLSSKVVRWTKIEGGDGGQQIAFISVLTPLVQGITKFEDVIIEPESVAVEGGRRPTRDESGLAPVNAILDELWSGVLRPIVKEIQSQGIDVIVVSDHLQQIQYSRTMMAKSEDIDVWISNGSGTLFWGNRELPLNQGLGLADIYPSWHESVAGDPVALLAGGDEGTFYSVFSGEVDALGRLVPHRTDPVTGPWPATPEGVAELERITGRRAVTSPRLERLVEVLQQAVERSDSEALIYTDKFLRGGSIARGTPKYPLQDMMADALLFIAATRYELEYPDGSRRIPRVSIINDGGNRNPLGSFLDSNGKETFGFGREVPVLGRTDSSGKVLREDGWISPLHVNRVFAFDDEVVVVDMQAHKLVEWFGWGVGRLDPSAEVHPGEFLHVSGAEYGYDEELPSPWSQDDIDPGIRITFLRIWDPIVGAWETVLETSPEGDRAWRVPREKRYSVVMRNFTLRRGIEGGTPGDNLPELVTMKDGTAEPTLLSELPQPVARIDILDPGREQLFFAEYLMLLRDKGLAIDDQLLSYQARMGDRRAPNGNEPFRFIGFDQPYRFDPVAID